MHTPDELVIGLLFGGQVPVRGFLDGAAHGRGEVFGAEACEGEPILVRGHPLSAGSRSDSALAQVVSCARLGRTPESPQWPPTGCIPAWWRLLRDLSSI